MQAPTYVNKVISLICDVGISCETSLEYNSILIEHTLNLICPFYTFLTRPVLNQF